MAVTRTAKAHAQQIAQEQQVEALMRVQEEQQQDVLRLAQEAADQNRAQQFDYDDATALNMVLAELGSEDDGGGFVVVNRETVNRAGSKEDEYISRFPAVQFSLESLKEQWGAGKYRIMVYHTAGGLATRKVITIAKDPIQQVLPREAGGVDLTPILQTMQAGFEKMFAAIMATKQEAAQMHAPSRAEMLQEMALMKDMFAAPAQQAPDVLGILKVGMEMANNAGGESNNAWVGKVLEQLGPILIPKIADGLKQGEVAQNVTLPAAPLKIPHQARVGQEVQSSPLKEVDPVKRLVINYLDMLEQAAIKNAPVDQYADSVLATVPEAHLPELKAMLAGEGWREKLKGSTGAIERNPVWFTALRDTILDFMAEDEMEKNKQEDLILKS
jgi:hypothetical protein